MIADDSAAADFVAADLLAQAEHDPGAQALLVTTSRALAERVVANIRQRARTLSRGEILKQSLQALRLIVVPDLDTAVESRQALCARASADRNAVTACTARRHHDGRFGVPGALVARIHG